jgi:hypothetical protein
MANGDFKWPSNADIDAAKARQGKKSGHWVAETDKSKSFSWPTQRYIEDEPAKTTAADKGRAEKLVESQRTGKGRAEKFVESQRTGKRMGTGSRAAAKRSVPSRADVGQERRLTGMMEPAKKADMAEPKTDLSAFKSKSPNVRNSPQPTVERAAASSTPKKRRSKFRRAMSAVGRAFVGPQGRKTTQLARKPDSESYKRYNA